MKKVVFLTGTRADFGKLKSLIKIVQCHSKIESHVFVTGMHLDKKYGETVYEIEKSGVDNIYCFNNSNSAQHMDRCLATTIEGFSKFIDKLKPDLIVVHGDRVEPLAGAIVGSLNNILVAHIEGGEVSGTIDELIRHSISKLSHVHLVSNDDAKRRLIQMGELESSIFVIGSPDLDLMNPEFLPSLETVKTYYDISFDEYAIAMFHPVTTEYERIRYHARNFVKSLMDSDMNYILIYPNNDLGSDEILEEYLAFDGNDRIRLFPSLRFEYFLRFLKEARFIIGNSSAGIREAPFYNVPAIDIGSRQTNRGRSDFIINCGYDALEILKTIESVKDRAFSDTRIGVPNFGSGQSDKLFLKLLESKKFWEIKHQKQFQDIKSLGDSIKSW